jgi:N,N'-diacetyllegionaminate synthase
VTTTFPSSISIAGRDIGPGRPPFIIAEVAQAHDGSLGTAHAYIDLVARSGAQAIKFQTHIASAESTPGEPFRLKFSLQDEDRYAYWKRMEFSEPQWRGLADHCRDAGLVFLSTPFSFEAVELLERLDMAAWKVGSGEVTNLPMLQRMAGTGRPVLVSSGMSSWRHLDEAMATIEARGAPAAVLQCTTAYPCPPERIGLNVPAQLRSRYGCPVGLSDHSGAEYAGLAAVALGADLLEVHVVISRDSFGPDVGASLTPDQLRRLVEGSAFVRRATDHPVDKDAEAERTGELRTMFGKSVVAARDLPAGHRLADSDLRLKKPGNGIPAARLRDVVGRTLAKSVRADGLLSEQDLA